MTCSPHHNHQDTPEYQVVGLLWLDQYLKGSFTLPQTPQSSLNLKTKNAVPFFTVTPDASMPIVSVDIYYTQQGQNEGEKNNHENTINRFWRNADAKKSGNTWVAQLPIFSTDKPLWIYANVLYPLDQPVTGAGYYYSSYKTETFNLSSMMQMATPGQLKAAGNGLPTSPRTGRVARIKSTMSNGRPHPMRSLCLRFVQPNATS